jgi:hypothetical protein
MANTNLDRLALLPNNDDWIYDFTTSDKYTYEPGGGKSKSLQVETEA